MFLCQNGQESTPIPLLFGDLVRHHTHLFHNATKMWRRITQQNGANESFRIPFNDGPHLTRTLSYILCMLAYFVSFDP